MKFIKKKLEGLERALVSLVDREGADKGHGKSVLLLLLMLKQFSHGYRAVVQLRKLLYDKGLFRHYTLGCQVISVGNLTVGGTGKTPVVEIFARELQKAGRTVAILSRGYKKQKDPFVTRFTDKVLLRGGRRPPRIVSNGKTLLLDSAMSGDEPYMLAVNLPDVSVLVDKDRVKSGRRAIKDFACDTLILDDGFQYRALKHHMEIVLVDSTNPFGNENVLPRGILREPVKNIKRADFIFLTKSSGSGNEALKARLRTLNANAEIIECKHCARYLKNAFTSEQKDLDYLKGLKVVAMSGIAAPQGFEKELERRGATILDRFRFADHHRYTQQEMTDRINRSCRLGADAIITTEKDAVRFPRLPRRDIPIYFLRVDIEILSGNEDFEACISRICFKK